VNAMDGNATDIAAESAGVVLMQDDRRKLPFVVNHARHARRIIIDALPRTAVRGNGP